MTQFKFYEAIPRMNTGDVFSPDSNKYGEFELQKDGIFNDDSGNGIFLKKELFDLNGVIIPAKKEMVSAAEYLKRAGRELGKWCAEDVHDAFKFSEQNRDILYADLLEIVHSSDPGYQNVADKIRELKREHAKIMSVLRTTSPD